MGKLPIWSPYSQYAGYKNGMLNKQCYCCWQSACICVNVANSEVQTSNYPIVSYTQLVDRTKFRIHGTHASHAFIGATQWHHH